MYRRFERGIDSFEAKRLREFRLSAAKIWTCRLIPHGGHAGWRRLDDRGGNSDSALVDSAANLREHVVGVRPDKANSTDNNH